MPPEVPSDRRPLHSSAYNLTVRQAPERAKVATGKEKDRKPVDPPPIIQLHINDPEDPAHNYLQSPYFFMCCTLWHSHEDKAVEPSSEPLLTGSLVSSLHRLKDSDNHANRADGGFFVFGDLSVKVEGEYRLRFSLYDMLRKEVRYIAGITTPVFTVFSSKLFGGMSESTFLSRSFGDQGVRLRIRKETRTLLKRPASTTLRSENPTKRPAPPRREWTSSANASYNNNNNNVIGPNAPRVLDQQAEYGGDGSRKRQRLSGTNFEGLFDANSRYNQATHTQSHPYNSFIQQAPSIPNPGIIWTQQGLSSSPTTNYDYTYPTPQSSESYTSPRSRQAVFTPQGAGSSYDSPQRLASHTYPTVTYPAGMTSSLPRQQSNVANPYGTMDQSQGDMSNNFVALTSQDTGGFTHSGERQRSFAPRENSYILTTQNQHIESPLTMPPTRNNSFHQSFTTHLPPLQSNAMPVQPILSPTAAFGNFSMPERTGLIQSASRRNHESYLADGLTSYEGLPPTTRDLV
ncbi:hypothetical protein MMC25_005874 [Agyrium rufum]|nr:hypothetical protein [Agyrium rufum]